MNILALDFGTKTGYCQTTTRGDSFFAGTWALATPKEVTAWGRERLNRRRDPRVARLFTQLQKMETPDVVVFEDVEFQTYTYQTQLWASFRVAAWMAFPERTIFECVPVGTLKKFATGSGGADKTGMARALYRARPGLAGEGLDDNAVDAVWLMLWAQRNLARLLKA